MAPLPPSAEHAWWYQYYFATERGQVGYDAYRREFNKLIWQLASPKWAFDDATFARSAAAFDNPDHVAIVIHNYRWRLSLAAGESQYDDLERQLASFPAIAVPTITLEGDASSVLDPRAPSPFNARPPRASGSDLVRLPPQECRNVEQIFRFAFRPQAIAHGTLPLHGRFIQHGVVGRRHR